MSYLEVGLVLSDIPIATYGNILVADDTDTIKKIVGPLPVSMGGTGSTDGTISNVFPHPYVSGELLSNDGTNVMWKKAVSPVIAANDVVQVDANGNLIDTGTRINDSMIDNKTLWSSNQISSYVINKITQMNVLGNVQFCTVGDDTLSGVTPRGGYTPSVGDTALVASQTNSNDNGVWIVQIGLWKRALWNGSSYIAVTTETISSQLGIDKGICTVINGNSKNISFNIYVQDVNDPIGTTSITVVPSTSLPRQDISNIYVNTSIGNDSNHNGTHSFPYATIAKALSVGVVNITCNGAVPILESVNNIACNIYGKAVVSAGWTNISGVLTNLTFTTVLGVTGNITLTDCTLNSGINMNSGTLTLNNSPCNVTFVTGSAGLVHVNSNNVVFNSIPSGWTVNIDTSVTKINLPSTGTIVDNRSVLITSFIASEVALLAINTPGNYITTYAAPSIGSKGDILSYDTSLSILYRYNNAPPCTYNNITYNKIGSNNWMSSNVVIDSSKGIAGTVSNNSIQLAPVSTGILKGSGGIMTSAVANSDYIGPANIISVSINDVASYNGTSWTNATPATLKSTLALNNVTNDAQLKRSAGDINTFTTKSVLAGTDILLIEDSAASFVKAKTTVSSIVSLNSSFTLSTWTPNTAVTQGQMMLAPFTIFATPIFFDGEGMSSNATRTTRSVFDALEAAYWTFRLSNGRTGNTDRTNTTLTTSIPQNASRSILQITLPTAGLFLLNGTLRGGGPFNLGYPTIYFSTTLDGDKNSSINQSNRAMNYVMDYYTYTGRGVDTSIYYYNNTPNIIMYLNIYLGPIDLSILNDANGYINLSYVQIR